MDSLRCRTKLAWYGRQAKVHSHLNSAINLRKSKKPAPKLNENQIVSITVDGEVFQGIKLDVVFMWSFWSRIGSIGEIIPIDKEVRRSTYSAQSSNSFQESSYWFKMDLNRGIEREDSWYQRLARAVVETALPLLDIHVAEEGRTKRSIYNDDITESHLLATWTQGGLDSPAIGANGRFRAPQHFPIHDLSLEDWKSRWILWAIILRTVILLRNLRASVSSTPNSPTQKFSIPGQKVSLKQSNTLPEKKKMLCVSE